MGEQLPGDLVPLYLEARRSGAGSPLSATQGAPCLRQPPGGDSWMPHSAPRKKSKPAGAAEPHLGWKEAGHWPLREGKGRPLVPGWGFVLRQLSWEPEVRLALRLRELLD